MEAAPNISREDRRPSLFPVKEHYEKDMKLFRQTATAVALATLTALTANAQQQPAARRTATPAAGTATTTAAPATQGVAAVVGETKIAIVNTEAFGAPQGGIARLVTAMNVVDREFQPRRTELQTMQTRYTQLVEDIKKTQGLADQATTAKKAEEAETLKSDIERKQQDAQRAFEKRMREAVNPVYEDIGKQMDAFARERGITVIFDASKLAGVMFIVGNNNSDITNSFITFYNQRNPASAASTTATPRK